MRNGGGWRTSDEDGGEDEWHKLRRKRENTEEPRRWGSERCEGARVLAYSDLNRHDQIHLGRSPEERAVQRAAECTLSTHREEILPAKSLRWKYRH